MRRSAFLRQGVPGIVEPPPVESIRFEAITPALLYRKLLKLYLRKFDTDHSTIVRAWKQTKYEFYFHRRAPPEERELLVVRGQQILEAIRGGVVPVYRNADTGETFFKYDKDTLAATFHQMDPVPAEEFVRRYADRIPKEQLEEIRQQLKQVGRWEGPDEFSDKDLVRLKSKRKRRVKCTDPDPEAAPSAGTAASATAEDITGKAGALSQQSPAGAS